MPAADALAVIGAVAGRSLLVFVMAFFLAAGAFFFAGDRGALGLLGGGDLTMGIGAGRFCKYFIFIFVTPLGILRCNT